MCLGHQGGSLRNGLSARSLNPSQDLLGAQRSAKGIVPSTLLFLIEFVSITAEWGLFSSSVRNSGADRYFIRIKAETCYVNDFHSSDGGISEEGNGSAENIPFRKLQLLLFSRLF